MANTKHSLAREILLDRLLQKRHGYTIPEMVDIINDSLAFEGFPSVSASTVNRDLDTLRYHYKAKIVVERRSYYKCYMYEDSSYSVFHNTFTFGELQQIHHALMAIRFVDPIQGTMMFEQLSERLAHMLEVDTVDDPIVLYKNIPSRFECQRFGILYQAIRKKKPVCVRYHSSIDKRARELVVHPYYILNDDAKYFLLGHDSASNSPVKIPISNISSLHQVEDTPFIPNHDFPLQDFYRKYFASDR